MNIARIHEQTYNCTKNFILHSAAYLSGYIMHMAKLDGLPLKRRWTQTLTEMISLECMYICNWCHTPLTNSLLMWCHVLCIPAYKITATYIEYAWCFRLIMHARCFGLMMCMCRWRRALLFMIDKFVSGYTPLSLKPVSQREALCFSMKPCVLVREAALNILIATDKAN